MQNAKFIVLSIAALMIFKAAVSAQTERQIAAIRAEVLRINNGSAKFIKKTKTIDNISTEGAEATYYTSGKELKKIVAKIYGEAGNTTNEYYYLGEDLIFAFQRANYFDKPIASGGRPKIVRVEELRAYFNDGDCIRLLSGKKMMKPNSIEFTEEIYAIVEIADQIKAAYRR